MLCVYIAENNPDKFNECYVKLVGMNTTKKDLLAEDITFVFNACKLFKDKKFEELVSNPPNDELREMFNMAFQNCI